MEISTLGQAQVIRSAADVSATREVVRRRRLRRVRNVLLPVAVWLVFRLVTGNPVTPGMPEVPPAMVPMLPAFVLMGLLAMVM
ncbi:MAG TPA: hypothetical protein VFO65_07465, partial [Acidimicrobiales bacterium]|nr:hypothetical protein [Acidimicrobiales bacterium]